MRCFGFVEQLCKMVESILEMGDFVYVLVLMELGVGLDNNSVIIIYMCKNGKVYING